MNENHYCILGAPGCGKTSALVGRIAQAAAECGSGESMLICSLTRTAAHEIASRVKLRIQGVEFPHVGTVHALALRALKENGDNPQLVYDRELIAKFNAENGRNLPLNLGRVMHDPDDVRRDLETLGIIDAMRAAKQLEETWPRRCMLLHHQWQAFKVVNGVLDFTDLITRAIAHLPLHPARPEYIFVDEAQDLSRLEVDLITQWATGTKKTIIAGDDEQALYEWRGASVRAFIDFAPPENQYVLPRSYRMHSNVQEYASALSKSLSIRIPKSYEPVKSGGEVLRRDARSILPLLSKELSASEDSSIMVLATCGYMLKPFLKEVKKLGIPFHNPYRSAAEGKSWNPLKSKAAEMFRKFLQPSRSQHLWTYHDLYEMTCDLKPEHVPQRAAINAARNSTKPLDPKDADDWIPQWFLEAAVKGDIHALMSRLDDSVRVGRGGSITQYGYLCRVADRFGVEALYKTPRLIVGTIHSVKGGEADVVFVFPWMSPAATSQSFHRMSDGVLRTFYVGVSRARSKLYLLRDGHMQAFWR